MTFHVDNPYLDQMSDDTLYHFGISTSQFDFKKMFNDVKVSVVLKAANCVIQFVCTGGSSGRFKMYAKLFSQKSGFPLSENISQSDRFCLYKTGPILWVNVSF